MSNFALAARKPSAKDILEGSTLRPDQLGGMGDLDVGEVKLVVKDIVTTDVVDIVTGADIERSIEAASTLTFNLQDDDLAVLRSGNLKAAVDVVLDGLYFRLAGVRKTDRQLDLVFEDREIALLRTYNKKRVVNRGSMTRAEFILSLIKEVKEVKIPYFIPELHKIQPIEKTTDTGLASTTPTSISVSDKTYGFPPGTGQPPADQHHRFPNAPHLTVKTGAMNQTQARYADIILRTGVAMPGMNRKVLVCGMMTAIGESSLHNYDEAHSDGASAGLFQQTPGFDGGMSLEERMDPATAARAFYRVALRVYKDDPGAPYWDICANVQKPRFDLRVSTYAPWYTEATRIVTAWGIPGGDSEISAAAANSARDAPGGVVGDYIYYRGKPPANGTGPWEKENSWACIQRLAEEVHWRAFFVSGTFYYLSEDWLFKQQPSLTIDEDHPAVDKIDFDYDEGKKAANITVYCHMQRWASPPGSLVKIENMGLINGRWLTSVVKRGLFEDTGTITLKKPRPKLPEPSESNVPGGVDPSVPPATTDPKSKGHCGRFLCPLDTEPHFDKSEFAIQDAEGAPNRLGIRFHAAKDWFAPGGSSVYAPWAGTIVEVKQSRGNTGQVFGGVVKLQEAGSSVVWVFRHVDPAGALREGARVEQGRVIAGVTNWASGSSHCHIEIWKTLGGGYNYENMMDPCQYIPNS